MKSTMKKAVSILIAIAMVFNMSMETGFTVNAAVNYDVVITEVGIYQKNGVTKVYAYYANEGTEKVADDFSMEFYIDKEYKGSEAVSGGLEPGETGIVTMTVSGTYSSTCAITAIADIADGKTANNNRTSYRRAKNTEPTTAPSVTTAAPTTAAPTTTKAEPYVTITKVEYTPVNPKEGDIVKITVSAKNNSSTRVDNKPVYVDIGNTRLQGTITIPAGGTGSVTVNDWTPSAGTYTAKVSLPYDDNYTATDSVNITVASTSQNMEAKVVAVGGYSENVYGGDTVTFTTLVQNTGGVDIPAGKEYTVTLSMDDTPIKTVVLSQAIPVNGYVKIETSWTATVGGHAFTASMDGSSVTKHLNVQRKINYDYSAATGGVDLQVTDIGYYNVTTGETNGSIAVGDLIQFIAYGVNAGDTTSASNTKHGVSFSINNSTWADGGTTWSDTFYGPLAPGAFHEFQANGGSRTDTNGNWIGTGGSTGSCWVATEGSNNVTANINDDNSVSEINRNNNTKTVSITVPYTVTFGTTDTPDNVNVDAADVMPGEVSGLTVTKANERTVSLSWTEAGNATSYNIYRNGEYIGSTISCSYTDRGSFTVGNNYTYMVKAVSGSTESSGTDTVATIEATTTEVQAYGVPQTFTAASDITMTANEENVGVFKTRVYENDARIGTYATNNPGTYTNVAMFDYSGDVSVTIKVHRTDISYVTVRPTRKGMITSQTVSGGYTYITMNMKEGQQGQYSIEFNGSYKGADTILLFAQEILEKPSNVWKTISSYEKCDDLVVPEGKILWIEGGAVLNGWVHCSDNSKIMGRGIITQNDWGAWGGNNRRNPLSVGYEPVDYNGNTPYNNGKGGEELGSSNVQVIGISVLDSTGWAVNIRNSDNVLLKDVNVITARSNGDGITIQSSYNVMLDGCFVRSSDDSIVVKNYDSINSHDILVQNCTVWTDIAQSLEIGYETDMGGASASRCEAGYANTDAKIYNIFFKDIDIVHRFHKGVVTIHNGDNVPITHVAYKNIYIDHKVDGSANGGDGHNIDIEAYAVNAADKSWTHNWHNDGYIRDIWFTNITANGGDAVRGTINADSVHWGETISDDFLGWQTLNFN